MGYVIRDSRSKANFDFGVPKRIVYSAESEIDEPVENVIEQEEEVIPEEAQGQSTEQAPVDEDVCRDSQGRPIDCSEASNEEGEVESDPMQQEEAEKQEAVEEQQEQEEQLTPEEMEQKIQEEADAQRQQLEEEKAKAEKEAAEAKAKADQAAADAAKKNTTSSKKSGGGGGGGGGRGPYMSKNDKLWKKKLSAKSKKPTTKTETKKSNVALRLVGGAVAIGSVYGIYKTMK
jgi:cobalamin biosynthesis Mg chelatase CobN|tara:strand:- start:1450 stop:2145 length:696 start_codon:yes stop_codon:yes gene_type:complete